jgi:hypothetical protein
MGNLWIDDLFKLKQVIDKRNVSDDDWPGWKILEFVISVIIVVVSVALSIVLVIEVWNYTHPNELVGGTNIFEHLVDGPGCQGPRPGHTKLVAICTHVWCVPARRAVAGLQGLT